MLITENIHVKSYLCLIRLQEAWMRHANFEKKEKKVVRDLVKLSRAFEAAVTNIDHGQKITWGVVKPLVNISEILQERNKSFKGHANDVRSVGLPLDASSEEAKRISKEILSAVDFPFHFRFFAEKKYNAQLKEKWGPIRRLIEPDSIMKTLPRVTLDESFRRELSL